MSYPYKIVYHSDDPSVNPQTFPGIHGPSQDTPVVQYWAESSQSSPQGHCPTCAARSVDATRLTLVNNSDLGCHDRSDDDEDSDDEDLAPDIALEVTNANLVAVLRLQSDLTYLSELVEAFMAFDETCRGKTSNWKMLATKCLTLIQAANAQISYLASYVIQLRNRKTEGVLVGTAKRVVAVDELWGRRCLDGNVKDSGFLDNVDDELRDWRENGGREVEKLKEAMRRKWKHDVER